ncbi:GPP34 family phosphoprotein [Agrococcus sp. Marseille-Q4369]|uniref:GPP34 family phosphoprotein n=1 Tax=Agrococcus sp. Marseille-Q4369 TaxID=2810513 RepID=UPI001B8AA8A1|nr:GPP34 family phosphoprotein [Agrococcus sp. Marseille-Q4369]QUW18033.1 GPP34 family phosphoprotein [Agrococcus sp. Marseille-Q4369]
MALTIPEAVLLLAIDDDEGSPLIEDSSLGIAIAGAALAQLVVDGRMRVVAHGEPGGEAEVLVAASGTTNPHLEPLVERIDGTTPSQALSVVAGWGGRSAPTTRVRRELLEDFAAAGVLAREEDRFLGIRWRERWERGERRDVEDALQARAIEVLDGADDPTVGAALAILHGAEALPPIFPDRPREPLLARGAELAERSWASREVHRSIEAVQAAMVSLMMSST